MARNTGARKRTRARRYRFQSPIVRTTRSRRSSGAGARRGLAFNHRHPHVHRAVRTTAAVGRGVRAVGRGVRTTTVAAHRRVATWGSITVRTAAAPAAPTHPSAAQQRDHEARRAEWRAQGPSRSRGLRAILERNQAAHDRAAERRYSEQMERIRSYADPGPLTILERNQAAHDRAAERRYSEQMERIRSYPDPGPLTILERNHPSPAPRVGARTTSRERAEREATAGGASQWTKDSAGRFTGSISTGRPTHGRRSRT